MMAPNEKALELLFSYNKIVMDLIQNSTVEVPTSEDIEESDPNDKEFTIDVPKWSVEYSDLALQLDSIKALYPAFFVQDNDPVMNLDLLQEQNVVHVLLYSAVMLQWPSLHTTVFFSVDDIHNIIQNNRELEALLRNLYHTSICKEIFKHIIIEEDESVFEAKLAELFNYVAEHSYYAHLPKVLHGVTAIGCKIFISSEYMKKIEDEKEEKKEEKKEDKEDEKEEKKEAKKVNGLEVRLRRDLKKLEDKFKWSPTLKILLHEIAVLATRFWEQQTSYFRITPREYINPSDPGKSYGDIGDYLESLLFGHRLKCLYRGGAKLLLNINSWNLPIDRFQSKFLKWQEHSKANGGNFYLLWSRKIEVNCVTFGRRGMSYWNSR